MAKISVEFQAVKDHALRMARQWRHEFVTLEHLLLALLNDPSVADVIKVCNANINAIRDSLICFIKENTSTLSGSKGIYPQFKFDIDELIETAIINQYRDESNGILAGVDILLAIFDKPNSFAASCLYGQNLSRRDISSKIVSDIGKSEVPPFKFDDEVMAILVEAQNLAGKGPITRETLAALLAPPIDFPLDPKDAWAGNLADADYGYFGGGG